MRRFIPFLCLFAVMRTVSADEPAVRPRHACEDEVAEAIGDATVRTRYLVGSVGHQDVLMILETGRDKLYPDRVYGNYYIYGAAPRPIPGSLFGRWLPGVGGVDLEARQLTYTKDGTETGEQVGFLAGSLQKNFAPMRPDCQAVVTGNWIETHKLTATDFLSGAEYQAEARAPVHFAEGTEQRPWLSLVHSCKLPSQTLSISVKKNHLQSFSLHQTSASPPFRQCSLTDSDFTPIITYGAITLIGKKNTAGAGCVLSVLYLVPLTDWHKSSVLISTEPETCSCRTRVVFDEQSEQCFNLFSSETAPDDAIDKWWEKQ